MGGDLSIRRVHSLPNHFSYKEKIPCAAKKDGGGANNMWKGKGSVADGREGKESSILHADDTHTHTHTHTGFPEKKNQRNSATFGCHGQAPFFPFLLLPLHFHPASIPPFPLSCFEHIGLGKRRRVGRETRGERQQAFTKPIQHTKIKLFYFVLLEQNNAAFSSKFGKCLFRLKKERGERGTVGREGGRGGPSILC